jgi:WD40 repeat protein
MAEQDYRYWAFISYSHRDKAWGDWLHKALETYPVPRRLVGREGPDGPTPRRLYPVFRDREELPSSADLSNNINDSLARSRYLVVICSPRAAVSRWVNEEVVAFKRLGRENRILALVVDGEPNAGDHPESGELECFPPALRHRVSPSGEILAERVEPIAADARPQSDGRANARLKLLAGLLGVPYDELRQREKQRLFRRRLQWTAATLVTIALLAGAWNWQARHRAVQAAIAAYTEQGRQLSLDNQPLQAAVYLGEAYRLGGRSPALRLLLARSMLYVDALRGTLTEPGLWFTGDITQDGKRLTAAGGAEDADVWDIDSGRRLLSLREPGRMQLWSKFSPDGRYIAVGSKVAIIERDMVVRVVDARDGKQLSSFKFDSSFLVGGMFSPDSRRLLTRSDGADKAQIWDAASGKLLVTLDGHGLRMAHAGFSPDGRYVITANVNHTLSLWDAVTGKMRAYLRGHSADVNDFGFSPDSRRLASASDDKSVKVWDLATGRLLYTIGARNQDDYDGGHEDKVTVVDFSHDGKRLITGSDDKTVRVWDASNGKIIARLARMPDEIRSVAVSDDGALIVGSTKENTTWLWDGHDYTLRGTLPGYGAFFTGDSSRVITFSAKENVAQVWDVRTLLSAVTDVTGESAAYSPDGTRLATHDSDQVWIWDSHDGKKLLTLKLAPADPRKDYKAYATGTRFSPDGKRLLALSDSSPGPSLWDAVDGKTIAQMQVPGTDTNEGAFSPDGARIFTCSTDKIARLWDGHDGKLLSSFPMPEGCLVQVHFSPDGTRILGTHEQNTRTDRIYHAEVWDLGKHTRVLAPEEALYSYNHGSDLSPDGVTLATADKSGILRLRDMAKAVLLRSWDSGSGGVESLFYSPDGRQLVTAHQNGTLKVWDAGSGTLLWVYKSGHIGMDDARYSPDGVFLMSRDSNQGTSIRDAGTGQTLLEIGGDSSLTETVTYAPNGEQLASRAYDMPTRLLDVHLERRPPEAITALVRCRVPWRLDAGQVLPGATDPAACPKP